MMEDAALLHRNNYGSITLKDLLKLRTRIDQIQSSQLRNALFSSIRLHHALNLLETQSLQSFSKFMDRLNERKRGFGMTELLKDDRIREACEKSKILLAEGKEHPKMRKILDLAKTVGAGERGIIFASLSGHGRSNPRGTSQERVQSGLPYRKEWRNRSEPKKPDSLATTIEGGCLRHSSRYSGG